MKFPAIRPASRFILLLLIGIAVATVFAACTNMLKEKNVVLQEVLYVTTRATADTGEPDAHYTEARGEMSYGAVLVAFAEDDRITPTASPQPNYFYSVSQPKRKKQIQAVTTTEHKTFFHTLGRYQQQPDATGDILVYIHGYKRDFAKTVTIAAQLRYELAFSGPVVAFAWPSTNTVSGYLADRENLDGSEPAFRSTLMDLATQFPEAKIHVLAHSMGNRALLRSLITLRDQNVFAERWPFGEIILVSPDVDRALFYSEYSQFVSRLPSPVTLYVSSDDFPLMASNLINANPRLGDARHGVPIVPGVETIDVSEVVTLAEGHTYYEKDPEAITDLYYLLTQKQRAENRRHLEPAENTAGRYWRLLPE